MPISFFSRIRSLVFRASHPSTASQSESEVSGPFDVDVWGERQTTITGWTTPDIQEARRLYLAACEDYPNNDVTLRGEAGLLIEIRSLKPNFPTFNTREEPHSP